MLFQQLAPMKSSQSALEPLELEPLELRLLPELELSLPTTPGDVVSAAAERSARAMKRSLLMASMQVSGFRLCRRETRRETRREFGEKSLITSKELCLHNTFGAGRIDWCLFSEPGSAI